MESAENKTYTITDIYNLSEGQRAELIHGRLYMMAPPSRIHQGLVMELSAAVNNYIKSNHGECKVYPATFAVFLNADEKTYVEPDISVVCDRNKLNDRGCSGAPDWIIEIVSPGSRKIDYGIKQALYLDSGVSEYWIVDPMRQSVMVYCASEDWVPVLYHFTDEVRISIFEDFAINFSDLML